MSQETGTTASGGKLGEDSYRFLPLEEAISPPGGTYFQHYVNRWWAVHPEKGLLFYNPRNARNGRRRNPGLGASQCNGDERIARMVCAKTVAFPVEVRLLESVWVPINIDDYRG